MTTLDDVLADLAAESQVLDALVAPLSEAEWRTPTPAEGWDIAHQLVHLAWTDEVAVLAATDKDGWDALVRTAIDDADGFVDTAADEGAQATGAEILARWRASGPRLAGVLRDLPDGARLPWFGPPMSATSMATARFMETWAHALDVADALGVRREESDRIRHVVHLGVRTRAFSHVNAGLEKPTDEVRVELTAPSGDQWAYGREDAEQRVTGPALDFALLVTQRRHRDDLALVATGQAAETWLRVAQAFAGPPGGGRDRT
ncbi:TIGR03084 family metal-binding protein [Nocardioides sp.]|uniref:TIGR03084 family metal-binding protein n=1 Tax=Nocardioides sp. TaxID=35761 RepID=UPI003D1113BF